MVTENQKIVKQLIVCPFNCLFSTNDVGSMVNGAACLWESGASVRIVAVFGVDRSPSLNGFGETDTKTSKLINGHPSQGIQL